MPIHTLRGQIPANSVRRLILDDGIFTDAYKITSFEVWAVTMAGSGDPEAILALSDKVGATMDAGDSRQIGWAMQATTNNTRVMSWNLIDPDHVVVRDLYLRNISANAANYLVTLEPISLTADQAVLQLIKERSQDDI
jgi:hypothetical protein